MAVGIVSIPTIKFQVLSPNSIEFRRNPTYQLIPVQATSVTILNATPNRKDVSPTQLRTAPHHGSMPYSRF